VRISCFLGIFWLICNLLGAPCAQERSKAVQPLPVEKLGTFLKEFAGWKAEGPPDGETVKTPQGNYSMTSRSYTKGEKWLEVTVVDGAFVPVAYEDYRDLKGQVGSSTPDTPKALALAGHPALEVFDKDAENATLMVLVKERLLVILDLDMATPKDDLKPVANQLDWKGLEALVTSNK
jgi:hypothetical protein